MSTPTEEEDNILSAIGSTEPSSFSEFCRGLKDCPSKGDTAGWREVFAPLEWLEHQGLVVIERSGRSIESLILTHAGADRIRAKLDQRCGLLAALPADREPAKKMQKTGRRGAC